MITVVKSIFDTAVDTTNILVSIKTRFTPRPPNNDTGLALLYLSASHNYSRRRINTGIRIPFEKWNKHKQRLTPLTDHDNDLNLIIDNLESKITSIKTTYRLTQRTLDVDLFAEEFVTGVPRIDFISFIEYHLDLEQGDLSPNTVKLHKSFVKKLRRFKAQIFFSSINLTLLNKFRKWMHNQGNAQTTIEANTARFKKYISAAKRHGILMSIEPEDIKPGHSDGNRIDLSQAELKKIMEYHNSKFINPVHKVVAGYFLFSCFNGNRISEVLALNRSQFTDEYFVYDEIKNKRLGRRRINATTAALIDNNPDLFVKKYSQKHINDILKDITKFLGITKKVSFHTSRHTFATNFLRMGGDAVSLQKMLGHATLKQTMAYVHIVEAEINEKVFLMDNLLD